jgi:hypothetical protein
MRITGRQLRQIIKEEVARMMNEEDAPSIMPSSFGTVTDTPVKMPGAGTMPASGRPSLQARRQAGIVQSTPAAAQADFDADIAAGRVSGNSIPLVAALETDSTSTQSGMVVPQAYNDGVVVFTAKLVSTTKGSVEYIIVDKVISATFDGKQNRQAVIELNANPYLDLAGVAALEGARAIVSGDLEFIKTNAKVTLVTSSRPRSKKDGRSIYGQSQFRVVTVKSIKIEPLA